MNRIDISESQDDLIRTCYQEMLKNPNEYRIMLRFSAMLNHFCNDSLRRQSTVDLFSNEASVLHPNLFRMPYEALKHHGFDRLPRPPPNSC